MSERDPGSEPGSGETGGDDGGTGSDEPIVTPTSLGDYEIREGEYGPLERRGRDEDDG